MIGPQLPVRLPESAYYGPHQRSAVYTHKNLRNWKLRIGIVNWVPGTRFDYDGIKDDTVWQYWYIGKPMAIFPVFYYHDVRFRAGKDFDSKGSFVEKWKQDIFPEQSPPPLLMKLADQHRKAEYVNLMGAAVIAVQHKYSKFETLIDLEPEAIRADEILNESLPAFVERMSDTFIELGELQMASI